MNAANSPVAVASSKKRVRRENRRFADSDRHATAFSTNELIKALTKTPTRTIPDIAGFSTLSKSEIKRDTKDIEKACGLMASNEVDFEGMMDQAVQRSMRPACHPEATVLKKKRRLMAWVSNPESADKELLFWEHKVGVARDQFAALEAQQEQWHEAFQAARSLLFEAHQSCVESKNRLRAESAQLFAQCNAELELTGGRTKRKRGSLHLRDLADELAERQAALEEKVEQIQAAAAKKSGAKLRPHVASISVSELSYPEDAVGFKKRAAPHKQATPAAAAALHTSTSSLSVESVPTSRNGHTNGHSNNGSAKQQQQHAEHLSLSKAEAASLTSSETTPASYSDSAKCSPSKLRPAAHSEKMDAVCESAELGAVLGGLEEQVRQGEQTLKDLELFFSADRDDEDCALLNSVLNQAGICIPAAGSCRDADKQQKIVAAHLAMDGSASHWARYVDGFFEAHSGVKDVGAVTRKKKKGAEAAVPLRAAVRPRTEHGVRLLLSPLSQYDDRMLGSLAVDSVFVADPHNDRSSTFHSTLSLPAELVAAEDEVLERCRLQSAAAAAQLKIAQLTQSNAELQQISAQSAASLKRIQTAYRQAVSDDLAERTRIRKELVYHGIAEADPSDPPLSPMSFLPPPSFGSNGAAKNGSNKPGSSRNRNGSSRPAGPRRPAQTTQQAINAVLQSLGVDDEMATDVLASMETVGRSSRSRAEPAATAAPVPVAAVAETVVLSQTSVVAPVETVKPRRGGPGSRGGAVAQPAVAAAVADTSSTGNTTSAAEDESAAPISSPAKAVRAVRRR